MPVLCYQHCSIHAQIKLLTGEKNIQKGKKIKRHEMEYIILCRQSITHRIIYKEDYKFYTEKGPNSVMKISTQKTKIMVCVEMGGEAKRNKYLNK